MSEFKLVRLAWDASASLDLIPAMENDPLAGVEVLKQGVDLEQMILLGVFCEAQRVGSVVLRPEDGDGVKEVVIVAAGGKKAGVLLALVVLPEIEAIASDLMGADTIRFHSSLPGLWALGERRGFKESERVYRKVLI